MLKEAPSQRTGKTMLSGTEATHHHQSLDDIVDAQSMTSYAATVMDIDGKGVSLPPPPKVADGQRDFECPYCYIICPARYGKVRAWRTHLLQDLQPYICTYPDCEASEQLFRSRREWVEHEASHRKAWRCPEHSSAVYRSSIGLEDHLRQQHRDSFPESQLDTIVKIGETSTVEVRKKCPVCFLTVDAENMGDFTNHIANHLERFAAFALPNSSEEDSDGASSAARRGRSGSTTSQDMEGVSLPSNVLDEEEQIEEDAIGSQRNVEELQHMPPGGSLLSMENLLSLPDVSQNRFGTLLAYQVDERNDDDDDDDEGVIENDNSDDEGNEEDVKAPPVDIQKHLERTESFRTYLLSLPGAQTVRFFRRYGSWRGNATFENSTQASQALQTFDTTLYPEVKLQQGSESNRNKLRFSVLNANNTVRKPPIRQSTSHTQDTDNRSISSVSVDYDNETTALDKGPVLPVFDIPTLRELYRSRKLLQGDQSFVPNDSYNRIISFCYHDITRLKVDAIVNSANNSMEVSKDATTLNYFIHKAGGQKLSEEARSKGRLKSGQAALTGGHNLPCDYVIHASRPHYSTNNSMGQFNVLTECYRSVLRIALVSGLKSVAFPCLGAGGCGFPPQVAARVALQEVREFLDSHGQHPFERIVFTVMRASDEMAYIDLFPVFFPPTQGDLEVARSSARSATRGTLATQILEVRLQVQKVAEDLSSELNVYVPHFPQGVLEELHGIDSTLASIRESLLGPGTIEQSLGDLDLFCFVIRAICGSITELTESAKDLTFTRSHSRSHKSLWDDYNNHQIMAHDSNLEQSLKDFRGFAQCLDQVLTGDGVEPDEMKPMRMKLNRFKAKQKSQGIEGIRDQLDEVLYTRDYQREIITQARDIVQLHQVPSITQLYASGQLKEKPTKAQPSVVFNHIVSMIREDITKLDVTVLVNTTDVSFAGMGTLDRKVFNTGGIELQGECKKFGVCKEGDIKTTSGYLLPAKYILHVIPPRYYEKSSTDVLRQIYRDILHTAQSLRATSVAIPSIGTGMLNYPRRDCTSLALEEVKRFLETAEPTNSLEKIVFVVYSSNEEFIYKSLLPVYFPPVDHDVNRALPVSQPISMAASPKAVPAPPRTLFKSIGDALRNLGSLRSEKRPASHTSRAINPYEEHALIGFESHAQECSICKTMQNLYHEKKNLCEHGYPLAQTLLWYMNLGPDQLVHTRAVQTRQSVRLEVPENVFPLSMMLLRLVDASLREKNREHPFVGQNHAYSAIKQSQPGRNDVVSGLDVYGTENARAYVEVWSTSERMWSPVSPSECNIFIGPGKLDVYEAHASPTAQEPLLNFVLDPNAKITKYGDRPGLIIHGAHATQFDNNRELMLLSRNLADSNALLDMLRRTNSELSIAGEESYTVQETPSAEKVNTNQERDKSAVGFEDSIASVDVIPAKIEPNYEQEETFRTAHRSIGDTQPHLEGHLSPLKVEMQRLGEAASRFDTKPYDEQHSTVGQLNNDVTLLDHIERSSWNQTDTAPPHHSLTMLEHQVLDYLTEDLKSRAGSYIGQTTKNIALALNRSATEILAATENLARQDLIHQTVDESMWVISHAPRDLPIIGEHHQAAQPSMSPETNNVDRKDVLLQMDLLEQQIISLFDSLNSAQPSERGYKAQLIADQLGREIGEVELALEQLTDQGRLHFAADQKTWNTPLSRQHIVPSSSSQDEAKQFQYAPSIPTISAGPAEVQSPPVDLVDATDPEVLSVDGSRWTRIDKAYVDPQILKDTDVEFHEDGYSLVVHRTLQPGELEKWVQMTLQFRLPNARRGETSKKKAQGGVSGHMWLGKGKDERDLRQANLERVLAGDMGEEQLKHFTGDEDTEKRRG